MLGTTPTKDFSNEIAFQQHSAISLEKPPPPEIVESHFNPEKTNFLAVPNILKTAISPEDVKHPQKFDIVVPAAELCSALSPLKVLSITEELKIEENVNNNEVFYPCEDSEKAEVKEDASMPLSNDTIVVTQNNTETLAFSIFQPVLGTPIHTESLESKAEIVPEESNNTNDKVYMDSVVGETKSECVSIINSTETSGNSSPVLDEMDDIQKKIHSFHTENIQILKIRNKKQPKEKRKKVNLNFDLSVSADNQTVEVKLKTDNICESVKVLESDKVVDSSAETSQCVSITVTPENSNTGVLGEADEGSISQYSVLQPTPEIERALLSQVELEQQSNETIGQSEKEDPDFTEITNNNFPSTNLFSDSFRMKPFTEETQKSTEASASIPDINVIKNAIDMTTNLDSSVFKDGTVLNSEDEYKNVQEILSRVNQMDSRNSVLLSGVLKDTNHSVSNEVTTPTKMFLGRSNDPRLNPPPVEIPKPVRRKVSTRILFSIIL